MNYTIERVKPGDEAVLAHIQTSAWKAGFRDILAADILERYTQTDKATAMYRQLLEQKVGNGYILKVEGQPHCIAFWDATRDSDMPGYAELICIHSLQDRWRKGFGSRMMERVLQDMTAAGYEKAMLWVFEDNTRARRFYEKHGFTASDKAKTSFGTTEVCYVKEW